MASEARKDIGNIVESIRDQEYLLEDRIRQYSRSQRETWRKVPYLALLADGRGNFNELYSLAYQEGYWALCSSNVYGDYQAAVKLYTGEIIDPKRFSANGVYFGATNNPHQFVIPEYMLASQHAVLNLIPFYEYELDAGLVIGQLKEESEQPYPDWYDLAKRNEIDDWRIRKMKEQELSERYTRKN